ncbi:MAG TPA: cyclic nucleotide-binding domain-containing protein [Pirellulales bacterium]|nr:cyclic nucleotide-binding domain-containing protein [Pirellulales bacterium]
MPVTLNLETLRRIPLLTGLNESEFRQIAEVLRLREFAPGEYVIRQGDQSRDLWIVLEGQCEVVRRLKPGEENHKPAESLVLAVLEPYSHFGEMSFFHPAPHSADVRARGPLELIQITHADYADMIQEGIWAAFKLAYNVVQQLAERLRRMDEWVAELANNPQAAANVPEFSRFRNKLFDGWTV